MKVVSVNFPSQYLCNWIGHNPYLVPKELARDYTSEELEYILEKFPQLKKEEV